MNHRNFPPRFSPFLGSGGEQERSLGILENAAATDFLCVFSRLLRRAQRSSDF